MCLLLASPSKPLGCDYYPVLWGMEFLYHSPHLSPGVDKVMLGPKPRQGWKWFVSTQKPEGSQVHTAKQKQLYSDWKNDVFQKKKKKNQKKKPTTIPFQTAIVTDLLRLHPSSV